MLAPQRRLWEEGLKDGDAKLIYENFCLLLKCGMICFSKIANCLCCIYNCIIICVWETKGFWTLILQWRIISTATQTKWVSLQPSNSHVNHLIMSNAKKKHMNPESLGSCFPCIERIASLLWWRCLTSLPPSPHLLPGPVPAI